MSLPILDRTMAGLGLVSGVAVALAGCTLGHDCSEARREQLPSPDRISCIQIVAFFWYNEDSTHRGRLDAGDLAYLHRMRDGTATQDDIYDPPLILQTSGTVVEITDPQDITRIVGLVQRGISESIAPASRNLLFGDLAGIRIVWEEGSSLLGYPLGWRFDDRFRLDPGGPRERWFQSPDLASHLILMSQKYSLRTWCWSNPELQKQVVIPDWFSTEPINGENLPGSAKLHHESSAHEVPRKHLRWR